jgi:hypothetical protein
MTDYEIIRSRRRTLALEITKDGRVLVRAPQAMSRRAIAEFVAAHQGWLEGHLARRRPAPPPPTQEEIDALKARAREVLPPKVAYYSRLLGLRPSGVKITAARTRYGSCSGKNSLCFSCFLMNSPEPAIDLVVVHELCHIRHKNHGPDFYALLSSVFPDHRERKKLLTMDAR